jgi:predicted O-linked N-acetylglucosamine transferase (SPINDLY family)
MGASYYDYVVTDEMATPASEQANFSERLAYLGACYLPSDSRRVCSEPAPSRANYGLPEGSVVFAAQSAPYKILPEMFDAWMRLLREVDSSVLWLRSMLPLAEENLRREAVRRGVDGVRLVFAPREPVERYLARFRLADLYLDTYPFGAHTTVNDALFAGLPVLTLAGRGMAARASASQLVAAGLPELIAATHDEYAATALDLGRDHARLGELTTRLRNNRSSNPLFDMQSYTRRFEEMLLRIAGGVTR